MVTPGRFWRNSNVRVSRIGWPARSTCRCSTSWFDLLIANQEDLGRLMTAEQGKPFAETKGEVAYAASFVEWFAEEAKRVNGEHLPQFDNNRRLLVMKQPIGVCAAITYRTWRFRRRYFSRRPRSSTRRRSSSGVSRISRMKCCEVDLSGTCRQPTSGAGQPPVPKPWASVTGADRIGPFCCWESCGCRER